MTEPPRRLLAALLLMACAGSAVALTPPETRGKALYFGGIGSGGRPIKALLAGGSEPIEADTVPCAGCHGEDGRGRSEGGIVPGDITWSSLTKPYGHSHGTHRKHPAFNERSLAAAVSKGVDPAGNALDPIMPRYVLSRADLAALTAYLKRIESDPPPGIEGDRLRLGVIVPLQGPQEPAGRDLLALLTAYLDDMNSRGGIYNRRIELVTAEATPDRQQTLANARRLVTDTPVLAVIGALIPAHEAAVAELLERAGVPLIGAVSDFPLVTGRTGFYLAEGLPARLRALLDRAGSGLLPAAPRLAVIHPDGEGYRPLLEALDTAAGARNWPRPLRPADAGGDSADAVVFIGSDTELATYIAGHRDVDHPLYLFLPTGAAVGGALFDLPAEVTGRILIGLPFPPPDPANAALRGWQREAGVGDRSRYAEALVLGAAQVVTEGLKRAGSDLSRAKLVAALESLGTIEPAPLPQLSFGASRHVGRVGASVVAIDRAHRRFRELGGSVPAP
jgi:ABC-type branched-subunit amino acid transport system substrate-binding protein